MKKKSGKFKLSGFWLFLAIYSAALVLIMMIGLLWVNGMLKDYELGMPDSAMKKELKQFESANIETLVEKNSNMVSAYEKKENIVSYLKEKVSAGELTFSRKSGEYTSENPVYIVKANDNAIAKVSLAESGKNGHGFSNWKVNSIEFGQFMNKSNSISITAPSKAVVTINGKACGEDILDKKDVKVETAKNVDKFVTAPTNNVYVISGLMATPEIKATLDGKELSIVKDEKTGNCTVMYPADEALEKSVAERIKTINTEYGKYIINRGSLTKLKSYMVGNASEYVSDIPAVWAFLYGKTYTYEFKTNEIRNFVKYSDDCFSCDVHFDLYVQWNTGDKNYDTNMTYTFIKQKNTWMLADFAIN